MIDARGRGRGNDVRTLLMTFAIVSQVLSPSSAIAQTPDTPRAGYLGFDRNEYPGDAALKALRQTFDYSSYWLNNPPGERANSWTGKRKTLQAAGFGFLVVFNGRTYAEIKAHGNVAKLGASDAAAAVSAARAEGFPPHTIIFLDQEQGGRLLPEQRSYLHAWVDGVNAAGGNSPGVNTANYAAGVYCSGIAAQESPGVTVVTAEDIRKNAGGRKIKYWIANDSCPPSPGCSVSRRNLSPEASGVSFVDVWQFSQSPKRADFARGCPRNYDRDGSCYAPGVDPKLAVDFDVSTSGDPSNGRTEANARTEE
ncbi:MAG TPA: glycoside hydrolase domain-containing protein [Terriglobales bacterium]|nr:glycoside hydrolase domain-containing protein [Terriglobales bacterium]